MPRLASKFSHSRPACGPVGRALGADGWDTAVPRWLATPATYYLLTLALATLSVWLLRRAALAPFGYALRAVRDARTRAEASGIGQIVRAEPEAAQTDTPDTAQSIDAEELPAKRDVVVGSANNGRSNKSNGVTDKKTPSVTTTSK
jgi:hypothetical protein